jgi:hypothetical protein
MKYDEHDIEKIYQENLEVACDLLATLPVAEGRQPVTKGLNGWVYEQTIRYCLCQELKQLGINLDIKEQVTLHGRTRVDLLVGKAAIEIKALGLFSASDMKKYSGYRVKAEQIDWTYFYVTRAESYHPYRIAMHTAFGEARAYFLDTEGDWGRQRGQACKAVKITCNILLSLESIIY